MSYDGITADVASASLKSFRASYAETLTTYYTR